MVWLFIGALALLASVAGRGGTRGAGEYRWGPAIRRWAGMAVLAGGLMAIARGQIAPAIALFLLGGGLIGYSAGWRLQGRPAGQAPARPSQGPMTRDEALAVLGLAPSASVEDIQAAYRRLMLKVHPDRGGSADLAQRLNRARDTLLG